MKYIFNSFKEGYLNFIKYSISHVGLPILVHVLLLSCLYIWLIALLLLKATFLNIAKKFMRVMEKVFFGLLKIMGDS